MVGLGAQNSSSTIDNLTVQRLPPQVTFVRTEDFAAASTLFNETTTGWSLADGRFTGAAPAVSLANINVGSSYLADLTSTFKTTGEGGFVFDYYTQTDYKYVTVSAGKITLGHRTQSGFKTDAVYNSPSIAANADETIGITLKGTTISVTRKVGTASSNVLSFVYNSVLTDGGVGMYSASGSTSFDAFTVKSDDPGLANFQPLTASTTTRVAQSSSIDWSGQSADLMAALGLTGKNQNASFPEFSIEGLDAGDDAELAPVGEVAWYLEL
jgi:hypothetical protein